MKTLITRMAMTGLLLVALACNRLDVEQAPEPVARPLRQSPPIVLVLDTVTLRATLGLDTAVLRSKPWQANSAGFDRGTLKVADRDGHILAEYAPKGKLYMGSDTGSLSLCQNGLCRTAEIIVQIPRFSGAVDPADTVTPPQPTTCTVLPTSPAVHMPEGASRNLTNPDGLESGALIDSASTTYYRVQIRPDGISLAYSATGSTQPMGFDDVYYRVRLIDNSCRTGHIPVVVGDTCEVWAHDDRIASPFPALEIDAAALLVNDLDCSGFGAADPMVRLKPEEYTLPFRVDVPGGSLTDTIIDARRLLYFRRIGAGTPVFPYYLKPDAAALWSRAHLTIP